MYLKSICKSNLTANLHTSTRTCWLSTIFLFSCGILEYFVFFAAYLLPAPSQFQNRSHSAPLQMKLPCISVSERRGARRSPYSLAISLLPIDTLLQTSYAIAVVFARTHLCTHVCRFFCFRRNHQH